MITIELTDEMIDYADNVACGRRWQAWKKSRKNHNGLTGTFDRMLAIDRLGARCELAGKRFLNPIRWNAISETIRRLPDLGDFVDVKGRAKGWHNLIVQKDDEDEFAFLLVSAERHPLYDITGWVWGKEAKRQEFWKEPVPGRPAYFIPAEKLYDPADLLSIVRVR